MQAEDPLTGLLNARAWRETLEREVARADANNSPLTVALLNIDKMSEFNAAHGVKAGDLMITEIAEKLRQTCRPSDSVGRVGGKEFGVLLLGRSRPQTDAALARLRTRLPKKPTVSMGVVSWHRAETVEQLLLRASDALDDAKQSRRG